MPMLTAHPETTARALAQLLIFSGRPDPRWEIRDEALTELTKRLAGLRGLDATPAVLPAPKLGYRGFLVTLFGPAQVKETIHAFQGNLFSTEGKETLAVPDKTGVEAWLIDQAKKLGFGTAVGQR